METWRQTSPEAAVDAVQPFDMYNTMLTSSTQQPLPTHLFLRKSVDPGEPPCMRSRRPRGSPVSSPTLGIGARRGGAALTQQPPSRVLLHHRVVDDVPLKLQGGTENRGEAKPGPGRVGVAVMRLEPTGEWADARSA